MYLLGVNVFQALDPTTTLTPLSVRRKFFTTRFPKPWENRKPVPRRSSLIASSGEIPEGVPPIIKPGRKSFGPTSRPLNVLGSSSAMNSDDPSLTARTTVSGLRRKSAIASSPFPSAKPRKPSQDSRDSDSGEAFTSKSTLPAILPTLTPISLRTCEFPSSATVLDQPTGGDAASRRKSVTMWTSGVEDEGHAFPDEVSTPRRVRRKSLVSRRRHDATSKPTAQQPVPESTAPGESVSWLKSDYVSPDRYRGLETIPESPPPNKRRRISLVGTRATNQRLQEEYWSGKRLPRLLSFGEHDPEVAALSDTPQGRDSSPRTRAKWQFHLNAERRRQRNRRNRIRKAFRSPRKIPRVSEATEARFEAFLDEMDEN